MKTSSLPQPTTERILESAWQAIARRGRSDISIAEIARLAGVSRQTLYLAFGDRAGLLLAMARKQDESSRHVQRMREIAGGDGSSLSTLFAFIDAWLDHLPEIYPVAVLLQAAAVTDADAASVIEDRLVGSLLGSYRRIAGRMAEAGILREGMAISEAADICWSLTHIDSWRHLVVEQGWAPERFRETARLLVEASVVRRDALRARRRRSS